MTEITHLCPPVYEYVTPCCKKTPFDLPRTDRITLDPDLVTCRKKEMPHPMMQFPGYELMGQIIMSSSRNSNSMKNWFDLYRCTTCGSVVLGNHPVPPDPDNDLAKHAKWHKQLTENALSDQHVVDAINRVFIKADSAGYVFARVKQ